MEDLKAIAAKARARKAAIEGLPACYMSRAIAVFMPLHDCDEGYARECLRFHGPDPTHFSATDWAEQTHVLMLRAIKMHDKYIADLIGR